MPNLLRPGISTVRNFAKRYLTGSAKWGAEPIMACKDSVGLIGEKGERRDETGKCIRRSLTPGFA